MKHIQYKTLKIMVAALTNPFFSQRMLWHICSPSGEISLGHVNKVVMDLRSKGFVQETIGRGSYSGLLISNTAGAKVKNGTNRISHRLVDPVGLLRYIALFRTMDDLRIMSTKVEARPDVVIKGLASLDVVFCLGTAQSRYSPYFRPDEVSLYIHDRDQDRLAKTLRSAPYGNTKVACYRIASGKGAEMWGRVGSDALFSRDKKGTRYTTKVWTVVDMFCDGKGAFTKPLLKELWGIEI